jgi:hypothetical protein
MQAGVQSASTDQGAGAAAISNQNAVNANTPVNVAGGNVTSGPSSADQAANSEAEANSSNDADTTQKQDQTQNVGGGSCSAGCGGAGAAQIGAQLSDTNQNAGALAVSDQNAVNANVPVNVAGGNITSGPSSANQLANSEAEAKASNDADTTQKQTQTQNVDGSSCHVGCGGAGAAQIGVQAANTQQDAKAAAISKQNAVNANVPVNIAGGDITAGSSSRIRPPTPSPRRRPPTTPTRPKSRTRPRMSGAARPARSGVAGPERPRSESKRRRPIRRPLRSR